MTGQTGQVRSGSYIRHSRLLPGRRMGAFGVKGVHRLTPHLEVLCRSTADHRGPAPRSTRSWFFVRTDREPAHGFRLLPGRCIRRMLLSGHKVLWTFSGRPSGHRIRDATRRRHDPPSLQGASGRGWHPDGHKSVLGYTGADGRHICRPEHARQLPRSACHSGSVVLGLEPAPRHRCRTGRRISGDG